jgi:membrane protein DedA with SNARE-associated domain
MMLEGMLLPIPSEVVMAFGGYLVVNGYLHSVFGIPAIVMLLIAGTLGNVTGATVAYYIGRYGGLKFIDRYGRYMFINQSSVQRAQKFFDKYGSVSVFSTRLIPIFRTFISLPAGVARMDIRKFILYTFIGTLAWNILLVYLGYSLGKNWESLLPLFDLLTYLVSGVLAVLLAYWLFKLLKKRSAAHSAPKNSK